MKGSVKGMAPVTVTHLPVTRRQICHHTIACQPGKPNDALTGHYRQAHPATPVGAENLIHVTRPGEIR